MRYLIGLLIAASLAFTVEIPQTEAGPLRNLIARGVERRQARRAEGRGFLPGVRIRHRLSHSSCGTGSCGVTSRTLSSCPCPAGNCPCDSKAVAVKADCPDCPTGVCPKP
jgi:hypothetical protein